MTNLLATLTARLLEVNPQAYLEQVPELDPVTQQKPELPYIVYKLPSSTDAENREDFIMEVTIWGAGEDTTEIEHLTDAVDAKFHRQHFYEAGKIQASIYRVNRLMIDDPDPRIRRRELRYLVQTYDLG